MMLKNSLPIRTFQRQSLKTRVTLFTLAIFVAGLWALAFYASRLLHEDMQHLLSEQQFSTVSLMADSINEELDERLNALKKIASVIPPALLANTSALQTSLEQQLLLQALFNAGTFVTGTDGIVTASTPLTPARLGLNVMNRDFMLSVLRDGKAMIGKPIMGTLKPIPVLIMATPIRDAQGKVIGALAGVTYLGLPSFLDEVSQNRYGKTGGYMLVAAQQRVIVTATDKHLVMAPLAPIGVQPLVDRFVQGFEGSGILVNPVGVEVLASAKGIPAAGWYAVAATPTAAAFAPIRTMQQHMLLATVVLTVLAGALTWWMLARQLLPMLSAVDAMTTLSAGVQPLRTLPIARQDEIGQMIAGFNRLIETAAQRKEALRESEFRWKFAIEGSGDGLWDWNVADNTVFFSRRWKEMLGFSEAELGDSPLEWTRRIHPADRTRSLRTFRDYLDGKSRFYISEQRVRCKDGSYRWSLNRGMVVSRSEDGKPLRMIGTHSDISQHKLTELALREKTKQLHTLSRRILETQETERRRVAHELHDELGQSLTAIKINLQMGDRLHKQPSDALHTENLRIVEDALQQVRRLALALRPSMLDDLGLLPALRWMAEQNATRSGSTVVFDTDMAGVRLAPEIETACFRIVQEALTNIARHAQAQRVDIAMNRTGDALTLSVHDDGRGFDLAEMQGRAVNGGSIGVLGMQERAELIGGQLDIESTPGQGSTVRLFCPLRRRGEIA